MNLNLKPLVAGALLALAWAFYPGLAGAADTKPSAPLKVAVLDFALVDTSLQGEMEGVGEADLKRTQAATRQVRQGLEASKHFEVVDTKPAAQMIEQAKERYRYLYRCNDCEGDIGKKLGADYVLVGWVQKVSNLILNMNIALREVPSAEQVFVASADMRGDTDESWSRAAEFLLNERLFKELGTIDTSSSGEQEASGDAKRAN